MQAPRGYLRAGIIASVAVCNTVGNVRVPFAPGKGVGGSSSATRCGPRRSDELAMWGLPMSILCINPVTTNSESGGSSPKLCLFEACVLLRVVYVLVGASLRSISS